MLGCEGRLGQAEMQQKTSVEVKDITAHLSVHPLLSTPEKLLALAQLHLRGSAEVPCTAPGLCSSGFF